jgi:hypothetical protein
VSVAVVRGIVHCHSDLSYDCRTRLDDLCATLRREGFHFVALTEHAHGITPAAYADYVARCQALSDTAFVAIPGLEVRCIGGMEIAGIGLTQLVAPGLPEEVTEQVRALGGYAIWVHPWKRLYGVPGFVECDAVEVLNGKVDGTLAPPLSQVRVVRRRRSAGAAFHAIFGLDLHDLAIHPRLAWVECSVQEVTAKAIVSALRVGAFRNRVRLGEVTSSGEITLPDVWRLGLVRTAYVSWNGILDRVPESWRRRLVRYSRPLVRVVKKRPR